MASAESNHVPNEDHFEGGANLNKGARKGLENKQAGRILSQFMRAFRTGILTASGAGDEVVTFSKALDTDNVAVMLTSDTVLAVPIIKNGTTPTKTGFTATVAAACELHWMAFDMGPTS